MTRAQLRVYHRLGKKQANRLKDIVVVEENDSCVILYVAFPGLYMTYGTDGKLIRTQTQAEWKKTPVKTPAQQLVFTGSLKPVDDDDVPF